MSVIKKGYKIGVIDKDSNILGDIELGGYDLEKSMARSTLVDEILDTLPSEAFEPLNDFMAKEKDNPGSNPGGNPVQDNFAVQEVMQLDLPEPVKQEWLTELNSGSAPEISKFKKLSNQNGRSAVLVLWADEHMTAIITDNAGVPFISETSKRDPEAFYLASAFLEAGGLRVTE